MVPSWSASTSATPPNSIRTATTCRPSSRGRHRGCSPSISVPVINAILDDIDAGLPDGNRYSDAPNAGDRAAWRVIEKHCPGKAEGPARQIIKTWNGSGLLIANFRNPVSRKDVKGLRVDTVKRPS